MASKYWNSKKLRCYFKDCGYKTDRKDNLAGHIDRSHNPDRTRDYKCTFCTQTFYNKSDLHIHVTAVHTKEKAIKCDQCEFSTAWRSSFLKHQKVIHEGKKPPPKYKCELCDYRAPALYIIRDHAGVHVDQERPFACLMQGCEQRFRRKIELTTHKLTHKNLPPKLFHCDVCPFTTSYKFCLITHERTHTNDTPFVCDFLECTYKSTNLSNLQRHQRKHHLSHSQSNQLSCPFPNCSFKTAYPHCLKNHQQTHNEDTPYGCELCDYKAKTKKTLRYHIRTKHGLNAGVKTIPCPLCCRLFLDNNAMKRHLRTHLREKYYKCSLENCAFSTHNRAALWIHMNTTHSEKRPYKCDFKSCAFRSKTSCNLKRHRKTHDQGAPVWLKLCVCATPGVRQRVFGGHQSRSYQSLKSNVPKPKYRSYNLLNCVVPLTRLCLLFK